MRVGIPTFRGCVSPVFDWARTVLIVDHEGMTEKSRSVVELSDIPPPFRAGRLAQVGVQTLLCGAISEPVAGMVESQGIRVVPGLSGEVEAVLQAFFSGRLPDPAFAMPGWRRRGGGMRGRHRHRQGRRA